MSFQSVENVFLLFQKSQKTKLYNLSLERLKYCCFGLLMLVIVSQSKAQNILSEKEAHEDIAELVKKMEIFHPGLYAYQDSAAYKELANEISLSIESKVSYMEFFNRLAPLVYEVKDLHTSISHSVQYAKAHNKRLPFVLANVESRPLLAYNLSEDTTLCFGQELVAIEDMPIAKILAKVGESIGIDNGNETSQQYYAYSRLQVYYPKFFEVKDTISTIWMDEDSVFYTQKMALIPKASFYKRLVQRYPSVIRKNLNYSLVDTVNRAAIIEVTSFIKKGNPADLLMLKFKKDIKAAFKQAAKDSVQFLAIDLRGNGGGFIPNVNRLLGYVLPAPTMVIDTFAISKTAFKRAFPIYTVLQPIVSRLYLNKKNNRFYYRTFKKSSVKPKKKYLFINPLTVFMDGGSYSATAMTITMLAENNRATFIGSKPAGIKWGSHAGSWKTIKLHHSKIRVRIPLYKIVHHLQSSSSREFVLPTIEVKRSLESFKNKEDVYLKAFEKQIEEATK